ncbi:MAG: hypothetical protein A2Y17_04855 [Clostridiales bacterium GWF2_38_85]|nr:MAG: hypothetical protein A2Y17_04855 [Clostridiales bacterium GWF2_38_85]HBL84383.1 hypothetical protein [Clostridiales bacterium]
MGCKQMIIDVSKDLLPNCLDVLKSSYEDSAVAFGMTEENCPYRGRTRLPLKELEKERNNGCIMYAYLLNDKMVAFLSLSVRGEVLCINDIAVMPDYQNQGIGNKLLHFSKSKAKELGCQKIRLGMIDDNTKLKAWYESHGFKTIDLKKYDTVFYTVGTMELSL